MAQRAGQQPALYTYCRIKKNDCTCMHSLLKQHIQHIRSNQINAPFGKVCSTSVFAQLKLRNIEQNLPSGGAFVANIERKMQESNRTTRPLPKYDMLTFFFANEMLPKRVRLGYHTAFEIDSFIGNVFLPKQSNSKGLQYLVCKIAGNQ